MISDIICGSEAYKIGMFTQVCVYVAILKKGSQIYFEGV